MGRRGHSVWDHWKVQERSAKGCAMDRVQCSYCPTVVLRHAVRCKRHLIHCEGAVPEEVRQANKEDLETREPRPPRAGDKPRIGSKRKEKDEDTDDDEYSSNKTERIDKKRAVELISDLLRLDDVSRKKPISQLTDAEWAKEDRELTLKIKREKLRNLRIKNEFYERMTSTADRLDAFLDRATAASDVYLAEKQPQATHSDILVYTGQEPTQYDHETVSSDPIQENRDPDGMN